MIDRFSVPVPPRCTLHQCVKGRARDVSNEYRTCILCDWYTQNLDSQRCASCLRTEHLDNFVVDSIIEHDDRYSFLVNRARGDCLK